jgi:hypothetical protein
MMVMTPEPFACKMTEDEAFAYLDEIKREIGKRLLDERPSLGRPENVIDLRAATELRFERMRIAFKVADEFKQYCAYLDQRAERETEQSDDFDAALIWE